MKTEKLKILIKEVLRELHNRKLNESSSGTLEDYEIEFDDLVIPGISTESDSIMITVNVEYEADAGSPARGMFGPPEHSSPAESPEVNIIDYNVVLITITSESGQKRQIDDFKQFSREQSEIVKNAVSNYVESNEDSIKDKIFDIVGDENSSGNNEPEYFEDK